MIVRRLLSIAAIIIASFVLVGGPLIATRPASAASAPCSVGSPPYPYHGFCATYSGANTWYGSYGPGLPTPTGWGFCAEPASSGGDYPAPDYDYVPAGPPAQANNAYDSALSFAFSEIQALGEWNGLAGQFTADQEAV